MKVYNVQPQQVQVADFSFPAVQLGESGRGRKLLNVACPEEFKYLESGLTKQGKPRLNASKSDKGWIARVNTAGAYIRGANGNVSYSPEFEGKINLIAKAFGAFGAAGRTGTWDDVLISTELEDFWLRVKPSRGDAYILLFKNGKVSEISYEQADLLDLDLQGSTPTTKGDMITL